MDKGYIENGFIVDLTNAKKNSEIIYELSKILDMPEAKDKHICLKLGSVSLSEDELTSVKTLVELKDSVLAFISTSSQKTLDSATALDIKISEFTNEVEAPSFDKPEQDVKSEIETVEEVEVSEDVSNALDSIFGDETRSNVKTESDEQEVNEIIQRDESVSQVTVHKDDSEETASKKLEAEKLPTLYLRKTIRSGQSISSDGNIIVIGDVNPGAEIIAKGDITVWGILGGIAHAGSCGNEFARIRALKLNPVQIRIADVFARRPDTVNLPYIQKSSEYIPEEAYAYKDSIIIRKFHEEN